MQEIVLKQKEIKLIDPRRTSLIEVTQTEKPKHVDPASIRKRSNRISSIEIIAAVSLAINVIQAAIIYVLQAGPI